MAVVKLSAIAAAGGAPASTDQVVGVTGGATDNLFTLAQIATSIGLSITAAKTLTVSNTLTLTATDGSTLAIGTGGTLGTAAFKNTGTSGATVPLLNAANTWSGNQSIASANSLDWNADTILSRFGAGILGLSDGVTATRLQVYNTTDSITAPTNYERGIFDWGASANVLTIGTEKGGTGTIRNMRFVIGGTNRLDYGVTTASTFTMPSGSPLIVNDNVMFGNAVVSVNAAGGYVTLWSGSRFGFASGTITVASQPETTLSRFGVGILGLTNGTSATKLQIYSTTDGINTPTNYSRVSIDAGLTAADTFKFGSEHGGTGTAMTKVIWQVDGTTKLDYASTTAAVWTASAALASTAALTAFSGTAIPAGGTAGSGLLVSSTANYGVFFGSGAPTLSAAKGSLYLRSDGTTTNDRAYINTNGTTTWTALTTAA